MQPAEPQLPSSPARSAPSFQAQPQLLLASASPRRAQILQTLGIPFTRIHSSFEEPPPTAADHADPARYVEHLAQEKARACEDVPDAALVLSADTIVWHNGTVLGKPANSEEAVLMLRRLRGQSHQVLTGVCLRHNDKYSTAHEVTTVQFQHVSDAWVETYVATGEPLDKAGSYGAQGKGALLVERIEGDFWNVVGLPLAPLRRLLETVGAPIESFWNR